MKKYIVPLPLVFAIFFFVWKKQEVEISPETFQEETAQLAEDQLVEPTSSTVTPIENKETEVAQLSTNDEPIATTDSDIRIAPSQAPPVSFSKPRVLEILDEVKIATMESVIKTAEDNQALDTRISLLKTSMKHPLLILEEKGTEFGQAEEEVTIANAHVATHFMLQVVPGTNLVALEEKLSVLGCTIADKLTDESFVVEINQDPTIDEHYAIKEALEGLQEYVDVVEHDYLVYAIKTPNDNRLLNLWGMHNTGQSGGTNDKDIDAPEAWDLQTGSKKVLVGVIDTGVDRDHEDLKANMWTNPNEIPNNGKDDDGNGYIDDVHGWDFANNDNNPHDDHSHGTHCAGTIGGVGNNGKGVVGVCWDVSMVGIKFLSGNGGGYLSDGVKSIAYGTKIGVNLTSNSWGGGGYSSTMKKAIDEANSKGIGFIAAAGNTRGNDNDRNPSYPASYDSTNIIAVGAHDHRGASASFSCYGKKSVDLFAPGVNTLSTTPGNRYASYSGTSMATPHVAGAYALLLSSNPTWKVAQVKDALMKAVDSESGLKEKCVTGGRLNVYKALTNEPPKGGLIAVSPTEIDFGKLSKGDSRVLPVTFSNAGTDTTTISDATINSSLFSLSLNLPAKIPAGQGIKTSIQFNGSEKGKFDAALTLLSDAKNAAKLTVPLKAEVIAQPNLVVSPESLHFGLMDKQSKTEDLFLANTGTSNLKYEIYLSDQVDSPNAKTALFATGYNYSGQLGDGSTTNRKVPVEILANAKKITLGFNHTMVIKEDGSLWGMGSNSYGELGDGSTTTRKTPVKIFDKGIQNVTAGAHHTMVLKEDGSLWAMGYNSYGQLGDGSTTNRKTPVKIFDKGIQNITAGVYHTMVIKEDGSLWAMGRNSFGQLGDGSTTTRKTPVKIFDKEIKNVATGGYHTMVLKEDGSLWAMGYNRFGQLGDGSTTTRKTPVKIFDKEIKNVATGGYHTMVLKEDGSLWAMGYNRFGQLGNGRTDQRQTKPVKIFDKGIKNVTAGVYHTMVLKEDGSLWAMGYNYQGQLGDGSTTTRKTPVKIFDKGIQHVATGRYHTMVLKEDGSLWAMGVNNLGQLGNGRTDQRQTKPVKIFDKDIQHVAAGGNHTMILKTNGYEQSVDWLTLDQDSGTINPNGKLTLQVKADAQKLDQDESTAYIHVLSNDPRTPSKVVKVTAEKLRYDGGLVFRPASLTFDELFVGQTTEKELEITNGKTDAITISRFVFRDSAFSHRLTFPMTLKAGEKVSAKIYFTPKKAGEVKSSALLLTSEGNGKSISLSLRGSAKVAPAIALNPGSIAQNLKMKEEKKVNLSVSNTGGSNLGWSIKGATTLGGKSFSLAEVFGMDHFIPLEKGAIDTRSGSTMSTTGGGPDHHGYSWSDSKDPAGPSHNWTDISKTGKLLSELSNEDDGFAKISLPFEVDFYGEKSQNVFISSNGYLTFEEGSMEHGHFPLPSRMMPTALISAFAMDLNPSRGGNIYYKTGQNELVVQYDKVKDFAGQGEYTFQIWLNRNGVIYFHYGEMKGPTDRATTGIQNFYGDVGLLVAYNNQQIQPDMTIRVATSPKWLHTSKNSGNLASGQSETIQLTLKAGEIMAGKYEAKVEVSSNDPINPSLEIPVTLNIEATRTLTASPTALNFGSVEVGANAQLPLVLTNTGNAPVSLNGASANANEFTSNFRTTTIEPGKSEDLVFTFAPTRGQTYRNQAIMVSNAGNSPTKINLSGIGVATPKLSINPESLSITVEAGSKATDSVVIDNYKGLADGTFSLKEIRSGATKSKSHFNEMTGGSSENIPADPFAAEHVPNELIVSFKAGKQGFDNAGAYNLKIKRSLANAKEPGVNSRALGNLNLALLEADGKVNLKELAKELSKDGAVEYVEPNYILRHTATPNDPNLKSQWALPKMQASKAWEITKGAPSVIVAVIDTGIDYNHPDLQGNIWKNPGEIAGNRKDDDGNGFVDDVYGWDFANNDNDPMDGNRHGTHVAGTIAAATNNDKHVAGVAWQTKLVAVKFLSDGGYGSTADAIDSIAYCAAMNFPISNNSWGGGGYSKALKDVIKKAGDKGQLFCAAAGNRSGNDNDKKPFYPASYDCANVISVAASDSNDKLAYFSCYGKTTVDIAAPGVNILNLLPNNRIGNLSGTSMATPHVAGAAALILSQNPSAGHQDMKNILMNTVDPIAAFKGKMVAEGRLNLLKVVEATGSKWLSVSPSQGTVGVGKEVRINVNVDATQLVAGQRKAIVAFSTNDPTAKTIELPVTVKVTGEPKMELSAKSFNFGEVWVNQRKEVKLTIRNKGTDTLRISAFTTGNSAFGTILKSLEVAAKTEEDMVIFAAPQQSGNIKSNLTIVSNDPDQRNVNVSLEVKAVTPPSLAINPISIEYKLEPNQKGEKQITISNSGQATGSWNAKIVELDKKRSRTHDMNSLVAGLNADGRAPEFTEPGNPLIDFGASSDDNKSHKNAHRFEGANTKNGLEVAVLGAEQSSTLINFGKELAKKNMISGVTTINVQSLIPKENELSAFDSIIVYSNYAYRNRNDLGNAISTYAKNGGGVVTMNGENVYFANSENWSLGGNWRSENYSIFSIQKRYSRGKSEMGQIKLPSHPLMQEVKSLSGSLRILHQSPESGSKVAALWRDGTPLVTFRESPASVVDLNFFPTHGAWDAKTDGFLLITNALEWAAQGGAPKWITGNPLAGTVTGGDTNQQKLSFDATSLDEGNYTAEVQFTTNDPKNPYQAAKVKLIVRENQAPVANSQTINLNEDGRVAFEINAKDEDGDQLSYSIVGQPQNGTLGGKAPNLTYTPKPNFNGTDTLSFKAFDGRKYSNIAQVTFKVKAVNDAPWARSSEVNASEDEFFAIDLEYGDPDGDNLQLTFTKSPQHGLVWNEFGEWYYLPDSHYNGQDSISFTVTDGKLTSEEATVTIKLTPTNDAPIAMDLNVTTSQNQALHIEFNASDIDGDSLVFHIASNPSHGTIEQKNKSEWVYHPFSEYVGKDSFTYRAKDSNVEGNLAEVTVNITEINYPPVVQNSTFSLEEDGKLQIKLIASDPNGDKLSFSVKQNPSKGKLTGKGPSYEYTPNKDFNGLDSFVVVANDGELDSNASLITLKVEGKNDVPNFVKSFSTLSVGLRETPFRMNVEVDDVDNDELTLTIAKGPQNGDCYFDEQNLVYLPKPGFEGLEEIVLELSDGKESVQNTFPISIARHQNPIHIHFDENQNADLVNMLYQVNEVLALNADRILELSAESKENALEAKYVEKLGKDAMELSAWIEKISNGELTGDFEFCATKNQNELHWKVAPFSAPASSVDTELNNKPSSVDNESEQVMNKDKPTTSNNKEESPEGELASSEPVLNTDENNEEAKSPTLPVSEEFQTDSTEEEVSSVVETNIDSKEESNEVVVEHEEPTVIASNDNSSEDQNKKVTSEEPASDNDTAKVKAKTEEKVATNFITELGSGWYEAPGIGTFYDAGNGWIYEPNMGWSFLTTCPSNCSAWLFNENLGWLWFDTELPNMAFANNNGSPSWIFYPESTFGQSDLVFDYTQNSWMEWK